MQHDKFDVYRLVLEDTQELNSRRRQLDSLYVAIITLVLGASAYVAFYSEFNNWLVVLVSLGIGIVGTAITGRWWQGERNLDRILSLRYDFLRSLEQSAELSNLGATILTDEWSKIYQPRKDRRYRSATRRLQLIFIVVFWLIPLLLAALTLVTTVPVIHNLIPVVILQNVRPFVLPVTAPK